MFSFDNMPPLLKPLYSGSKYDKMNARIILVCTLICTCVFAGIFGLTMLTKYLIDKKKDDIFVNISSQDIDYGMKNINVFFYLFFVSWGMIISVIICLCVTCIYSCCHNTGKYNNETESIV